MVLSQIASWILVHHIYVMVKLHKYRMFLSYTPEKL